MELLTLLSALACGLIAGVFFAFSAFVMKALARLPAPQGIAAMQSINVVVLNPIFLAVFLGAGAGCVGLLVASLMSRQEPGALCRIAGTILYLAGTILVTRVGNIPLNDALMKLDPASSEGERFWREYIRTWTMWNHVRTAASLAAAALLTMTIG